MDKRLIIHLKTGHIIKGSLTRPFGRKDLDVEILADGEQCQLIFSLDEICYIRFAVPPLWLAIDEPVSYDELQTITDEIFNVAFFADSKCRKGIIGLLADETLESRNIFFTASGIRYRNDERLIGEVLSAEGMVTDAEVAGALQTQEGLRSRRMGKVVAEEADLPEAEIEQVLKEAAEQSDLMINARVGDILVEAGLVTRAQLEQAFENQQKGKKLRVGQLLVSQGLISDEQLLSALATKFRLEFVNLDSIIPSEKALGTLSEGLVSKLQVFPIDFDGRHLVVATSAPTDPVIGDSLRFSTNYAIELVIATPQQIAAAIKRYYRNPRKDEVASLLASMTGEAQSVSIEEEEVEVRGTEPDSEVIALINRILLDAHKRGASDVHFEPGTGKNPTRVRYRVDGECFVAHQIPATFKSTIIARIKIIAGLDISEHRRPQSGKIIMRFEQRKLEYRVEITPTVGGLEDAVLRLLSASQPLPLSEMGLLPHNLERFKEMLDKPHGIIFCVGPTGSGKTTTLHSALGYINTPERKIWTVEDPVEITQAGLRQVQVNSRIGFTFAEALRSFLRADPDVIMIGEMRDQETAKIAIEASLTGHLVLSTLHTNSAPETAVRLIDMEMDRLNFADAIIGVIAQRLARKLCDHCKKAIRPRREVYDQMIADFKRDCPDLPAGIPTFETASLKLKNGCEQCGQTGYRGRIPIHELMVGSPQLKAAIRQGRNVDVLRQLALDEGMWTLRMDGIMKVFSGLTDIEQVRKVCM